METALIYCRVSDPRQADEGNSLATQERQARDYAARHGYALSRVFIERGESAKTDARPVLQEMLAHCRTRRNDVQVVIVPKIDRLARNAYDYARLKLELGRFGLRLESVGERIEDTPVGRFTENVLASAAQFDNEIRAERSKGGMIEAVEEGRWVWKAPRGYRNVRIHGKGTIEPDPGAEGLVRQAFEKLASGRHSPREVSEWLSARGIRMATNRLHEMVNNKAYVGVIEAFGRTRPAAPPFVPLVLMETFLRAQATVRRRKNREEGYEPNNPEFPLRGTLRCECSRLLTAGWSKGRSGSYAYYRCLTCERVNLKREEVESRFVAELSRFAPDPLATDRLRETLGRRWKERHEEEEKRTERSRRELSSLKELRRAISLKNAKGVIPDDLAREQIEDLTHQIMEAEEKEPPTASKPDEIDELVAFGFRLLSNLGSFWESAGSESKKRLQGFLYPDGLVFSKNRGFRTADYPLLEELKGLLHGGVSDLVDPGDEFTNLLLPFLSRLRRHFAC